MTHVLLTFLGRSPRTGYTPTRYRFPDGVTSDQTTFFADALVRKRRTAENAPQKVVILGTSTSMWERALTHFDAASGRHPAPQQLLDAIAKNSIDGVSGAIDDIVAQISTVLSQRSGLNIVCRLIPYCTSDSEALDVAEIIASEVTSGDVVECDVTHGFRHLPMLTLAAAAAIEIVRDASVAAIWYGAMDMTSAGLTPVLRLDGYLELLRWVRALSVFQSTGDLRDIAVRLRLGGADFAGRMLEEASFQERLLGTEAARKAILNANEELHAIKGFGALFRSKIVDRLAWCDDSPRWRRQRSLALQHRDNGDHMQAVLLLYEAFVTMIIERDLIEPGLNPDKYVHRDKVRLAFRDSNFDRKNGKTSVARKAFEQLSELRNHIAHSGARPSPFVQQAIKSRASLRNAFDQLHARTFGALGV